jgi:hypothetical protein
MCGVEDNGIVYPSSYSRTMPSDHPIIFRKILFSSSGDRQQYRFNLCITLSAYSTSSPFGRSTGLGLIGSFPSFGRSTAVLDQFMHLFVCLFGDAVSKRYLHSMRLPIQTTPLTAYHAQCPIQDIAIAAFSPIESLSSCMHFSPFHLQNLISFRESFFHVVVSWWSRLRLLFASS